MRIWKFSVIYLSVRLNLVRLILGLQVKSFLKFISMFEFYAKIRPSQQLWLCRDVAAIL